MEYFWKRKKNTVKGALGEINLPPFPARKEFVTMLEMLRDAEKYDVRDEKGCRDMVLNGLCDYIKEFTSTTKAK